MRGVLHKFRQGHEVSPADRPDERPASTSKGILDSNAADESLYFDSTKHRVPRAARDQLSDGAGGPRPAGRARAVRTSGSRHRPAVHREEEMAEPLGAVELQDALQERYHDEDDQSRARTRERRASDETTPESPTRFAYPFGRQMRAVEPPPGLEARLLRGKDRFARLHQAARGARRDAQKEVHRWASACRASGSAARRDQGISPTSRERCEVEKRHVKLGKARAGYDEIREGSCSIKAVARSSRGSPCLRRAHRSAQDSGRKLAITSLAAMLRRHGARPRRSDKETGKNASRG